MFRPFFFLTVFTVAPVFGMESSESALVISTPSYVYRPGRENISSQKNIYAPNELIQINFSQFSEDPQNWIAVFSFDDSDEPLQKKKLDGKYEGQVDFDSLHAGNYRIRARDIKNEIIIAVGAQSGDADAVSQKDEPVYFGSITWSDEKGQIIQAQTSGSFLRVKIPLEYIDTEETSSQLYIDSDNSNQTGSQFDPLGKNKKRLRGYDYKVVFYKTKDMPTFDIYSIPRNRTEKKLEPIYKDGQVSYSTLSRVKDNQGYVYIPFSEIGVDKGSDVRLRFNDMTPKQIRF